MLTNAITLFAYDHDNNNLNEVNTIADAVAAMGWGDYITTLNPVPPLRVVETRPFEGRVSVKWWPVPEVIEIARARVNAAEADDSWPGAAYEADLVVPEWRSYRATGSTPWCRMGDKVLKSVPRQVRC
jgi:hypothetical protein